MKRKLLSLCLVVACLISCLVMTAIGASAAEEADIYPLEGASIRVGEDAASSGLRFTFRVKKAAVAEGDTVGALIIPVDLLGDTEFTVAALDAQGKSYLNIETDPERRYNGNSDETYGEFHASIVNLKAENYAREFVAVAYIKTAAGAYTYSAVSDSRSVYTVAKNFRENEDWATAPEGTTARVTSYLDSVVEWNPYDGIYVTPAGYVSPHTVAWADGKLTVIGEKVSEIKSFIIGKNIYTGGWTVSGTTLTANYTKEVPYKTLSYTGASFSHTSESVGSSYLVIDGIEYQLRTKTGISLASVTDGDNTYVKLGQEAGSTDSAIKCEYETDKALNPALATKLGESKTLVVSLRLATNPESDTFVYSTFRFRGSANVPLFITTGDGKVTIGETETVIAELTEEFQTLTFVADFKNSTITAYVNGAFAAEISVPALNESYLASLTSFIFEWPIQANSGETTRGLCLDDLSLTAW